MDASEPKPIIVPAAPDVKRSTADLPAASTYRPMMTAPIILGEVSMASAETQTTVGAAGGATALPATPTGYIKIVVNGTEVVMPYYAQS